MKEKIKKQIKMTITYTEYEGGMKSIKYDEKKKEIVSWVARDYLRELLEKDNNYL